jgi:3-dehydroquinate synthase
MLRFRPPARALILVGFMGSGKSAVGRRLAERLGLAQVETDDLIEAATGRPIPEIFAQEGEPVFRAYESAAVREAAGRTGVVISTGGGALGRPENVQALRDAGPIVYLAASPDGIYARTRESDYRPLLSAPDPRAEIARLLAARAPLYAQADFTVDTDGRSVEEVAERVREALRADGRGVFLLGEPVQVPVSVPGAEYVIHLGTGLLPRLGELVPPPRPGARAAVITSETLCEPYGEAARQALQAAGWEPSLQLVPDGEQAKRMAVAETLCGELVEAGHDRGSWVFGVGGGVISDLAGFVAAIFLRGVPFVTVPTSLLAQVDAGVGGKVAVNLPQGKNLVGAFHQPRAVVMDLATLDTLPARQWAEGWAEIIKHAAIADEELLAYLERDLEAVRAAPGSTGVSPVIGSPGDARGRQYVVARNCQIKAEVVAQDPREQGWRAVLNFGHTVAHALERGAEEWALGHGEAVALGMIAETRWAEQAGLTPAGTAERLARLLERAGLPRRPPPLDWDRAAEALRADKKLRGGRLALPVLTRTGAVRLEEGVGLAQLEQALVLSREG